LYISIPKIPTVFIRNTLIAQVISSTIDEFNFEEQDVIFAYCCENMPVKEAASLAGVSMRYAIATLVMFSEKLSFKIRVFEKTGKYDTTDTQDVKKLLERERKKKGRERRLAGCYAERRKRFRCIPS